MKAVGLTDKGLVRSENQDAYKIATLADGSFCCVVCDGMGGHQAGNIASAFAIDAFLQALGEGLADGAGRAAAMELAAVAANASVFEAAANDPHLSGMGTTLVAALLNEDMALIANIGDSRAYHILGDGIFQVTCDHSLVAGLIEKGEITPEEARTHPGRNLITRAIGTEETVLCDTFEIDPRLGGFLILCSDGLSNLVSDKEIMERVKAADEAGCKALLDLAYERGAPDNVTVVIIEL